MKTTQSNASTNSNVTAKGRASVIVPVYFNEGSIRKTFEMIKNEIFSDFPNLQWEVIFIDDGSADCSLQEIEDVAKENPGKAFFISLTRNFGQIAAIRAGCKHASGDFIISMSADLQDPPSLFKRMVRQHMELGTPVVAGVREDREESSYRKLTSAIFYKTMRALSFPNMPVGGFDVFLLSRTAMKDAFFANHSNPFMQGEILWTGHETAFIPYLRLERTIGKSRWTFGKKIKYLIDGVLGYSYAPIRAMALVGIVISAVGMVYATYIFIAKITGQITIEGWAPLAILILILSGVQMVMLGVIGEYLWRTLDQVRGRAPYIISRSNISNRSDF